MKLPFKIIFENTSEKYAFRTHMMYSIIDGIILGVLALNEFVFLKSLKGTSFQVGFLFQFSVLVLVSSIVLNELVNRTANKQKLVKIIALITRLPLAFIAFFPYETMYENTLFHWIFLSIFFIYYSANPIIFPIINRILRNAYQGANFGTYYSYAATINKVVMMLVTFLYGIILDFNVYSYLYAFPIISFLGIWSLFTLAKIPYPEDVVSKNYISLWNSVLSSIKRMKDTLKSNRSFKDFEIGFMLYGFAFMGTVGVIAIYFDRALHLNYSSVAFYKNSYNLLAILLLPFFGKLIGKIDPRKFAIITYFGLAFYLLFIGLTEFFPNFIEIAGIKIYATLMIAMLSNGLFAATMALLWYIGSAYFCKPDEVSDYQSIHLTLTGLRSFFAPIIGIVLYEWFGFFVTFMIGFLLLLFAMGVMYWSLKSKR